RARRNNVAPAHQSENEDGARPVATGRSQALPPGQLWPPVGGSTPDAPQNRENRPPLITIGHSLPPKPALRWHVRYRQPPRTQNSKSGFPANSGIVPARPFHLRDRIPVRRGRPEGIRGVNLESHCS